MSFIKRTLEDVIEGDSKRRLHAVATLGSWFAMGAFICSTISYHLPIFMLSEGAAAVAGGSLAAVIAFFIKSV